MISSWSLPIPVLMTSCWQIHLNITQLIHFCCWALWFLHSKVPVCLICSATEAFFFLPWKLSWSIWLVFTQFMLEVLVKTAKSLSLEHHLDSWKATRAAKFSECFKIGIWVFFIYLHTVHCSAVKLQFPEPNPTIKHSVERFTALLCHKYLCFNSVLKTQG